MGGAQRPAKFAKYFPDFGWEPTVLTVKPIAYWAQDPQLLEELDGLQIVRTGSLDPQRFLAKLGFRVSRDRAWASRRTVANFVKESILPLFFVPDTKILWWPYVYHAASTLVERNNFEVLYTTSPPHSAHLVGRKLARKYDLKWVADFRDSWSGGVVVREPTRLHRKINESLQESVIRGANAVICVSEGIRQELQHSCKGSANKIYLIPNGFDEEDYPSRISGDADPQFVFCHCGSITQFSDPEPLLIVLKYLMQSESGLTEKVKFQFVGYDATGSFEDKVRKAGLQEIIQFLGHQPHRKALQYLVDANALVLIAQGPKGANFIPGKTFEYLGARKPILAITNVQDTINLLKESGSAIVLRSDEYEKIRKTIIQMVEGQYSHKMESSFARQFQRQILTGKLAGILDAIQT